VRLSSPSPLPLPVKADQSLLCHSFHYISVPLSYATIEATDFGYPVLENGGQTISEDGQLWESTVAPLSSRSLRASQGGCNGTRTPPPPSYQLGRTPTLSRFLHLPLDSPPLPRPLPTSNGSNLPDMSRRAAASTSRAGGGASRSSHASVSPFPSARPCSRSPPHLPQTSSLPASLIDPFHHPSPTSPNTPPPTADVAEAHLASHHLELSSLLPHIFTLARGGGWNECGAVRWDRDPAAEGDRTG
jgi:hypothetical protein